MGRMLDNWRYTSRLSRAVFVAIGLACALLWTLWQWPAPVISRTSQTGHVISAVKDGAMLIELDNGKHVRTFTSYPTPAPGDQIPIYVETYEDGTVHAVIDQESLRAGPR